MVDKDCPSLSGTGLQLSTANVSVGTTVKLGCDQFGYKPSGSVIELTCLTGGNWSHTIPSCEWSWEFNTREKVIFGTSVGAGAFVLVVLVAILVAYFCCYKKKQRESEEKLYESSYHGSSPRNGYDGPYSDRDSYPVTYLAYQDINDGKYDGYANTGTLDKPWLGYIPRPKVTGARLYN
ncbi:hypothetical protein Btru_065740 [Bulinus truncatus]|nr:hypothetical protein Btru_065740 [Bulinus truncatus]